MNFAPKPASFSSRKLILICLIIVGGILIIFLMSLAYRKTTVDNTTTVEDAVTIAPPTETSATPETPALIDLQPVVDNWLAMAQTGEASVLIYDFDHQQLVASHNPDRFLEIASLYKLFVVYEGYLEIEQGIIDPNAIATENYTYAECLDLAIRESHSSCAEAVHRKIGYQKLQSIVEDDWGFTQTSVTNIVSTPTDILKIIQKCYYHSDLSSGSWSKIVDSMLNQPKTAYDWRGGLPAGFTTANVYNKVGWSFEDSDTIAKLYHDAAIVEFPAIYNTDSSLTSPAHSYAVIVMTTDFYYKDISRLGSLIEFTISDNN